MSQLPPTSLSDSPDFSNYPRENREGSLEHFRKLISANNAINRATFALILVVILYVCSAVLSSASNKDLIAVGMITTIIFLVFYLVTYILALIKYAQAMNSSTSLAILVGILMIFVPCG